MVAAAGFDVDVWIWTELRPWLCCWVVVATGTEGELPCVEPEDVPVAVPCVVALEPEPTVELAPDLDNDSKIPAFSAAACVAHSILMPCFPDSGMGKHDWP